MIDKIIGNETRVLLNLVNAEIGKGNGKDIVFPGTTLDDLKQIILNECKGEKER